MALPDKLINILYKVLMSQPIKHPTNPCNQGISVNIFKDVHRELLKNDRAVRIGDIPDSEIKGLFSQRKTNPTIK